MTTLQDKISYYNRQFGFIENPEDFNFELSPEPLIYKNEALRSNNRDLYAEFLSSKYPKELEKELAYFDEKVSKLVQIDKEKLMHYMKEKGYNLLKSDLKINDQDTIFQGRKVSEENLQWELEGNTSDLLKVNVTLEEAFENKQWIYFLKD